MTTPEHALELIDDLERLGFDDSAFARLHHWRAKETDEKISFFWKHYERPGSFQDDGKDARVTQRLGLVLNAYLRGGFTSGSKEVFRSLADAAWAEVPPLSRL